MSVVGQRVRHVGAPNRRQRLLFTLTRSPRSLLTLYVHSTIMASNNTAISTTNDGSNVTPHQKCSKCRKSLPLSAFSAAKARNRVGEVHKTCRSCALVKAAWRIRKEKEADKENVPEDRSTGNSDDDDDFTGVSEISVDTFETVLSQHSGKLDMSARVDLSGMEAGQCSMKEKADRLAEIVWGVMHYRFMCVSILYYPKHK